MTYGAMASGSDGCIVYLTDSLGRLLQMWAAPTPEDFRLPCARLVASLTFGEFAKASGS